MIQDREPNTPVIASFKPIRFSPRWPALAKMMHLPDRGWDTQPNDDWVGQLLLSGSGQQSLPGRGTTRPEEATTVAVCQA